MDSSGLPSLRVECVRWNSYVTKDLGPFVLKKIGFTHSPTAMVTSRPARDLGLPIQAVKYVVLCRFLLLKDLEKPWR